MPCYNANGTLFWGDAYKPCNQVEGTTSTCCATNKPADWNQTNDVCQPNGLCKGTYESATKGRLPTYWRTGCTDRTWDSPFCLKGVCINDYSRSDSRTLQDCPDGTWCCGADETASCCTNNAAVKFKLAATVGVSPLPSPTSTVAISTSSAAASTATPPPASERLTSSNGLSTGAKAGIGAGVALGVLALIGLAVLVWWRRKQKQLPNDIKQEQYQDREKDTSAIHDGYEAPMLANELESDKRGTTHELHAQERLLELPGHRV
ncbi:hypothetical protein CC86DRAFT_470840 [Ophiobolus disseminans]|uniref:Mid2 domain-containing protein n=1 Tax=Ophiobolus disseminans TaxID=1469910 RepID=A0A6A6ZK56_9PLEO|nr:hypothetical protein CC86DRAFT_470840 [Ophiobolus disseminans]